MRQAFEQAWGTVHLYAGGAFPVGYLIIIIGFIMLR